MARRSVKKSSPDFPYKTHCDLCPPNGKNKRKRQLWSYFNKKKGQYEARCKKHLTAS